MKTKETPLDQSLEKKGCNGNRCPDYDGCIEGDDGVGNPVHCFMGGIRVHEDGTVGVLGIAKGYCPLIHTSN